MLRVKAATAINGDSHLLTHKFIAIRPLDATGVLLLLKMKYLISDKQLIKLVREIMDNYKRYDVSDQALEIIIQQRLSELKVKWRMGEKGNKQMKTHKIIENAISIRLKSIANNAGMIGNVATGMEDDLTKEGLDLILERVGQIREVVSDLYGVIKLAEDIGKENGRNA